MKIIRKLFLILLLIVLIALTLFVGLGFVNYVKATNEVSISEKVEEIKNKKSYVTYDEISEELLQATVAIEDRRFYEHHGVEYRSMARALYQNVLAGQIRGGGSTITQQLAKNQYFTQEQTVERKIAEVFMALTMEQHFSKRTILELYVNSIYFGDGYEGIGSASWGYFGKAPSALDADECTLLAGIPNAPSVYALSQNPGLARERQQEVLRKLVSYDYLGQDAAQHILGNLRALAA